MRTRAGKSAAAAAAAALLAGSLLAAPSVEITNVQQQYPWTNTVDITYTVQGVNKTHQTNRLDHIVNDTYFATFEAKNGNTPIQDVNGNTVFTNGLVQGNGTFTAQWQPKTDLQLTGCTMTPSVFRGEENAYLVVNLETNKQGKFEYWFEPMSTQEDSNNRYNTDEYKTTKLVLRRVPAGTYTIGENGVNVGYGQNSRHQVPMAKDYYMGVFLLTNAQYMRIMGRNELLTDKRPRVISYNECRGGASFSASISKGSGLVGTLWDKTDLEGFDLPTASMFEVAARAGNMSSFISGNTSANIGEYAWYNPIANGKNPNVGEKKPNNWGLYDVIGHMFETTRDCAFTNEGDLKDAQPDGQTSANTTYKYSKPGYRIEVGFGRDWTLTKGVGNNSSFRFSTFTYNTVTAAGAVHGARLSYIAK